MKINTTYIIIGLIIVLFVAITYNRYQKYKNAITQSSETQVTVTSETKVETQVTSENTTTVETQNNISIDTSPINDANNVCIDEILSKL